MAELCAELKAMIIQSQKGFTPAKRSLLVPIVDQLRRFQPVWDQMWPNAKFQAAGQRTNATLDTRPVLDPSLAAFETKLKTSFKPQIVLLRGTIAKAVMKFGPGSRSNLMLALLRANNETASGESDINGYLSSIERLRNLVAKRKKELAAPPASGSIRPPVGRPPPGRPGGPSRPAPRPPTRPPGATAPPTSQQLAAFIRLAPRMDGQVFGPFRIPATVVENRHPTLTIHVTVKSTTDAVSNVPPFTAYPPYYQRLQVPPNGSAYVGVAVPGPTAQRFTFSIERCEL